MGATRNDGYAWLTGTNSLANFARNNQPNRPDGTNNTPNSVHSVRVTIATNKEITVEWTKPDGTWETLINGYRATGLTEPEHVKVGFTGGTGGATAFHEIRNFQVRNAQAIPEPGSISLALGVAVVAAGACWRCRRRTAPSCVAGRSPQGWLPCLPVSLCTQSAETGNQSQIVSRFL
jgi:hypothetical protein